MLKLFSLSLPQQQDLDNFKRKEKEQESKEIRGVKSPNGQPSRSPEHAKCKVKELRDITAQCTYKV